MTDDFPASLESVDWDTIMHCWDAMQVEIIETSPRMQWVGALRLEDVKEGANANAD